ncbi:MAG: Gfo/Idh/MocA family oxidoreductase [Haloarculaceae archaeon]
MIRYAVIGCAGIGPTHAAAVERVDGAELVACADLDPAAADAFADEYDCAAYTDTAEMVADADVDAVSVCTPSGTHADVTIEAARAGAHVLCEKPLDVYADRIDRMVSVCEAEGVTLAGVFQKRTHESVQRAKRAVEDGEIGDLVLGDAHVKWFRSQGYYDSGGWRGTRDVDGGVLLNQAVHSVDKLQWLAGGVEAVHATTGRLARDLECEDTAAIAVEFETGALGTVSATTATKGGTDRVELNGTEGSVSLGPEGIREFEVGTGETTQSTAETESRGVPTDGALRGVADDADWGVAHTAVIRDFLEAVETGSEPMVPAREAREAVDVVLAAYESADRGERVELGELRRD